MRHVIVILTLLIFVCSSCKKENNDDNNQDNQTTYKDFSKLTIGNYWVYEIFEIDTNGNGITINQYDSCYVEGDTVIHGNTFYIYSSQCWSQIYKTPTKYLRDSLQYIVDHHGNIMFSSLDFGSILWTYYNVNSFPDTVYKCEGEMVNKDVITNTPSGQYLTYDMRITYHIYPNYVFYDSVKYQYKKYSENIGIVTETLPLVSTDTNSFERRLIRYNVN